MKLTLRGRQTALPDAEYVQDRLNAAGEALMALPSRGCFPARIRSSMPDYIQLPDGDTHKVNPLYSARDAEAPRPTRPTIAAITAMEEVYFEWIPLLPWDTALRIKKRRILLLRTLNWPESEREDPHVWSWRRLGLLFDINHETVHIWHARTVDELISRMPRPCAITLRRIMSR